MGHDEIGTYSFKVPDTTIAELRQWAKMLGTIYHRITLGTFKIVCMREYTPSLQLEGGALCIDVTVWAPLTMTCVSVSLNLLI